MFDSNHIRTLASWSESLGLVAQQSALYNLYHRMTVVRTASAEEINSLAICAIQVIRDTEQDKLMFYRTMTAWGM